MRRQQDLIISHLVKTLESYSDTSWGKGNFHNVRRYA